VFDLNADNIGILREAQNSIGIIEITLNETRRQMGTWALWIRIKHMDSDIVPQCVLQEHAAQLAAAEQCDNGLVRHGREGKQKEAARGGSACRVPS
jgi:hypothetical protein